MDTTRYFDVVFEKFGERELEDFNTGRCRNLDSRILRALEQF